MTRIRSYVFSLLLLTLFSASAFAQTRRISGRVTVEGSGEPVAGASVNVVGSVEARNCGCGTRDHLRLELERFTHEAHCEV